MTAADAVTKAPRIDVHVHLAGVGAAGSGCCVWPRFSRRYTFRLLRLFYGISDQQLRSTADEDWARLIHERLGQSQLDHVVALGMDGVYDDAGQLDQERSQMLVPSAWVFDVCRRYPGLLPGPSVNPFRADAIDELQFCIEQGAVLIKWLPLVQDIDPANPRLERFYALLADAGIPLLIHMGGERTFATTAPQYNDVNLLRAPLDSGVPVICAHSATSILFAGEPDQLPLLKGLMVAYPHLWADNSGMCNPARFAHLPKLARDPIFQQRTLYGSDFPVPSNAVHFLPQLGPRGVWALERTNYFDRDIEIKRQLGYPDETLSRASCVLANLHRWIPALQ